MTGYIARRLVLTVPIVLIVGTVTFALVHLTPGDPAAIMLGPEATPEEIADLRDRLGLDEPLPTQYLAWIGDVIRLDFGESIFLNRPVTNALLDRVAPTAQLAVYAIAIAIAIGLPAGVFAALHQNSIIDRALMLVALGGAAVPNFFLGIVLILIFAVTLHWLPSGGYIAFSEDPAGHVKAMILPAFALGFSAAALPARLLRSTMLDALREDYVVTAVAKGLSPGTVAVHHALRNALLPAVTALGYSLGDLLGGAVIVETVFGLPGMGQLVVNSISRRDFPVIQGAVMLIALVYVLVNLAVDVLYVYLDPRLRHAD